MPSWVLDGQQGDIGIVLIKVGNRPAPVSEDGYSFDNWQFNRWEIIPLPSHYQVLAVTDYVHAGDNPAGGHEEAGSRHRATEDSDSASSQQVFESVSHPIPCSRTIPR